MNPMNTIARMLIQIGIFLFPLFFLPVTRDTVNFNKHIFLIVAALILVIVYCIRSLREKRFTYVSSPLDIPVLLFALSYLASLLISSPNILYALTQPAGAGTIFSLTLILLFARQFVTTSEKTSPSTLISVFVAPLLYAAAALSFMYIFQVTGIMTKLPVPEYLKSPLFSPTGSLFTFVTFLGVCLIVVISDIAKKETRKHGLYHQVVTGLIIIAGLTSSLYVLTQPSNRPTLLPQLAGWTIAVETLKAPRNALFGVAPGNFINVFTREKPATLNTDEYWVLRYNTSSNYFFGILSEVGMIGLAAFVYLLYQLFRHRTVTPAIIAILVVVVLTPVNMLLLFMLYMLLAVTSHKLSLRMFPAGQKSSPVDVLTNAFGQGKHESEFSARAVMVTSLVGILLSAAGMYFAGRAYAGEVVMTQAVKNLQTTQHKQTYDLQLTAIQLNPYHPDYRIIFSRTNLALANLIAGQEGIDDNQKETVTQLITQSVNNAKIAVQLYPSAVTWENLADIYSNLINVAEGADSWTIGALNQALLLDPSNPALRIRLGGIYYALGQYDAATRQFELAVQLKGNYANAWYNLANSQKKENKLELAALSFQQTLRLLDPESPDYAQVKSELDAIVAGEQPQQPRQPQPELGELSSPESTASTNLEHTDVDITEETAPEFEVGPEESVNASQSADLLL